MNPECCPSCGKEAIGLIGFVREDGLIEVGETLFSGHVDRGWAKPVPGTWLELTVRPIEWGDLDEGDPPMRIGRAVEIPKALLPGEITE